MRDDRPDPDFAFEPIPGLPERPPRGEEILWQGRPATLALARTAFKLDWIAAYFAALVAWHFATATAAGGVAAGLAHGLPYVVLGAVGLAVVLGLAHAQARAAIYTVTTARVILRVGAALPVTFNIPFAQVLAARLETLRDGTGTIALQTPADTRLAYAALWPHARPWHFRNPEPALRAIPDAERVAALVADAAETRVNAPVLGTETPAIAAE